MKILLLGANGQMGFDLQKAVASFLGFDLKTCLRDELDITNLENIKTVLGEKDFDVLINCTSYHRTDEVESHADQGFLINAFAVKTMAEVCKAKKAKLIHISTDYVFGGNKINQPLTEESPPAPLNIYGSSKYLGEVLSRDIYPEGVIIFRVASLFGVAGSSGKGGNFIETMLRLAKEKGQVKVVSDQTMSPTSTLDLAHMIFKFLKHQGPAGIYHAVNSGVATWFELAKTAIEHAGIKASVEPILASDFKTPAMRPSYSALDNTKLEKIIGPIRDWHEALLDYLRLKEHCS